MLLKFRLICTATVCVEEEALEGFLQGGYRRASINSCRVNGSNTTLNPE